ncbi:hypothetical protein BGZ61DRAFT_355615 [Ilyonectria robusta]|uniref:uncharacterized protein n=1 Tax=Ilyonectria robusta TaxID=1079257 RepID=UPI001E8DDA8D|nr:uncharacterized protein BGZ61DRAFT_355615 [Ilyonectria robusta]KAH8686487.1 hypothetical protein BGZ61DRAFT_355615 [Ilyonectria robusta]
MTFVILPGEETVFTTIEITTTRQITATASNSIVSSTRTTSTGGAAASETTPTIVQSVPSSGVSTGAIAGAAVGCAVAGLIFGFVVAWLLLRRRWRKNDTGRPDGVAAIATTPESKDYASVSVTPSGSEAQIDQFLLIATPDKEIGTELQSLGDLIHQHVENHYEFGPSPASASVLSQSLVNLGFTQGSGLSANALAALCIRPESRQAGLRHVLSHIIFRSIDLNSRSSLSMLPAPLAAFLQSIPPAEQQHTNLLVTSLALSKWRSLSALLLHPNPVERSPLPVSEDVVGPQALALANALNTFLHHFVASDEQTSHLQAVIIECTKLGYVLLSQPSDWQFVFETDGASTRKQPVVVCAGLEKLGHGDGTRYSSPRRVVEPLVTSV